MITISWKWWEDNGFNPHKYLAPGSTVRGKSGWEYPMSTPISVELIESRVRLDRDYFLPLVERHFPEFIQVITNAATGETSKKIKREFFLLFGKFSPCGVK